MKLVTKERQDLLLQYDSEAHMYTKERYLNLEEHVKILEKYKKEAEACILMMEEENLKLKNEILSCNEELTALRQQNISGKWRLAALKDKQKKELVTKTLNQKIKEEEGTMEITPIQNITKTVG